MKTSASSSMALLGALVIGLTAFLIAPGSSAAFDRRVGYAQAQDQPQKTNQEVTAPQNPFDEATEVECNYWEARSLMQDFKLQGLFIVFLLFFVAITIYRRYIKKRLPDSPSSVFVIAYLLYLLSALAISISLYLLSVHYKWMGFDSLNKYVNSGVCWPQIQKTWSLGLGSFFVAHSIDLLVATLVTFLVLGFFINWLTGLRD
jgi:hypothetical protein